MQAEGSSGGMNAASQAAIDWRHECRRYNAAAWRRKAASTMLISRVTARISIRRRTKSQAAASSSKTEQQVPRTQPLENQRLGFFFAAAFPQPTT